MPIVAALVRMVMLSFGIRFVLELINLPVPLINDKAIEDLLGSGSKIKSSTVTKLCSVSLMVVSSLKVTPILPLAVSSLSIELREKSITLSYGLSLTTLVCPLSSVMLPISTSNCCALIVLVNTNSTVVTRRSNFKPIVICCRSLVDCKGS